MDSDRWGRIDKRVLFPTDKITKNRLVSMWDMLLIMDTTLDQCPKSQTRRLQFGFAIDRPGVIHWEC